MPRAYRSGKSPGRSTGGDKGGGTGPGGPGGTNDTQPAMEGPDLGNMHACVEDSRRATLDQNQGPADPDQYHDLLGRLTSARFHLPPLYRQTFSDPYTQTIQQIGPQGFMDILVQDPPRERLARLMLDLAHAVLQNGEGFQSLATDSFQEVLSDLYDGFLSAEDRRGVKPPDDQVLPPLAKWGNPEFGPYTWTIAAAQSFGVETGIVSLPPSFSQKGLMGWSALGHETAGHDILHADRGLKAELAQKVRQALQTAGLRDLDTYWSNRIDETASDVLGILNMGPAAGIGLIAYFRGLRWAFSGVPKLSSQSGASHPADVMRGYLAAALVSRLSFQGAKAWADAIAAETDKDAKEIVLSGRPVSLDEMRQSADVVAEVIARTSLSSLEHHALIEIQDWNDSDEEIVQELHGLLTHAGDVQQPLQEGTYAAHVVAAAVTAGLRSGADLEILFPRMIHILKEMHDHNLAWGPLFIAFPSTIERHSIVA